MTDPFLSIIIPAHNEAERLPRALEQLTAFLDRQTYTFEILVVENGSQDNTLQVAQEYAGRIPHVRSIHLEGRGKGLAVREGIFQTSGKYRFITDTDFSMSVDEINAFLPPACNADVAIASREAPGSKRYNEPVLRHLIGRMFNLMIRLLVLPGVHDTQCGFKCFRAEAAEDIFRYQTLNGWSFDVEVLKVARLHGWQIQEIPISWNYFPGSKVSIIRDSVRMFMELLIIRRNAQRGDYARKV